MKRGLGYLRPRVILSTGVICRCPSVHVNRLFQFYGRNLHVRLDNRHREPKPVLFMWDKV